MKLLVMQFSPTSRQSMSVWSKYSQHPVLLHPRFMFLCYTKDRSLESVISVHILYNLLMFGVPNLISILLRVGRLSKESVQVRGFV
jgi:hypothetical protein